MLPGAALELKAGEPSWYAPAAGVLYANILVAFAVTPAEWPFTLLALFAGGLVLHRVISSREAGQRFPTLNVHTDFALTLRDCDGTALVVAIEGRPWVSPWLIVVPVRFPSGAMERIVISRDLNNSDAFRRFTVICRFGFAVDGREGQNVTDQHSKTTGA